MPRYLTEKDIADFRAELCRIATERFARAWNAAGPDAPQSSKSDRPAV